MLARLKVGTASVIVLAGLPGLTPFSAQAEAEADFRIEEIVVTATRRETGIQSTALSINAVTGTQLQKSGYVSIGQFLDSVPGVTSIAEGPGENKIIIRNIATSSQDSGSAVTATYMDDFAVSSNLGDAPEIRLVDMERVEVLKGPQGTLFGRSAMGGIIRYISNKPDMKAIAGGVDAYVSGTRDGGTNVGGSAYFNLPITDRLAMRFVGYNYENSGFIDNVELGIKNHNDESTVGGRLAIRWQPSDTLTLDLTYIDQSINAGPNWVSDVHTANGDIPLDPKNRVSIGGIRMKVKYRTQIVNFRLDKEFDGFGINLLASHLKDTFSLVFDQREYVGLTSGCACDYLDNGEPNTRGNTDTLEVRVVSSKDRFIDYIFGAYYEDSLNRTHQIIRYLGETQDIFGGFLSLNDGDVLYDNKIRDSSGEKAVYGELGLNVDEHTRIAFGYRYSDLKVGFIHDQALGSLNLATGGNLNEGIYFSSKEKKSSYKFTVEHNFSDNIFVYALASSGYRRGGFNQPTFISPFSTYNSDSLWNYELGIKSDWLDGRVIANISAFYLDFSKMQLVVQDPLTFVPATRNIGKAGIPGVELNLAVQATNYLTFNFGGSWTDPELKNDVPGGLSGKKGDRLPGSANKSFSISSDLDYPIGNGFNLVGVASYKYVGKRLNDFNTDLDVALPSYDILDVRLGLHSEKGYRIMLFADNVLDEAAILRVDHQGPTFNVAPTTRPRTIGLNVSYNF